MANGWAVIGDTVPLKYRYFMTFTMSKSCTADTDTLQAKDLFRCSTCWTAFTEETSCYDHMLSHQKSDNDRVVTLHKGAALYQEIQRKRKKYYSRKYIPHTKCIKCEKECGTKEQLKEHMKTHKIFKTLCCKTCGKIFPTAWSLAVHQISHTNEHPFQCDFCGKTYKTNISLKYHLRLHTRKDLEKCEKCGKEFAKPGQLRVHQMCHSNERPFICEVCGFGSKTKYDLVKHSTTHSSAKSVCKHHKCKICHVYFSHKVELQKHGCIRSKQKFFEENNKQGVQTNCEIGGFDHDYSFSRQGLTVDMMDSNVVSSSKDRTVTTSGTNSSISVSKNRNNEKQCSASIRAPCSASGTAASTAHHSGRGTLLQIALPQAVSCGRSGQVQIITLDMKKFETH